ncbi:hypothetical protein CVT26_015372 [Gymnopilus dilepis]|uniref:DUF7330 domain-containing protein n=1 Tax=Gymnopilus dilepis TaxID=231916 RepID=A0A409WA82_9AGAR|nr:hypothetical protein CVT26_015372 [Gymnopilus dilepis]
MPMITQDARTSGFKFKCRATSSLCTTLTPPDIPCRFFAAQPKSMSSPPWKQPHGHHPPSLTPSHRDQPKDDRERRQGRPTSFYVVNHNDNDDNSPSTHSSTHLDHDSPGFDPDADSLSCLIPPPCYSSRRGSAVTSLSPPVLLEEGHSRHHTASAGAPSRWSYGPEAAVDDATEEDRDLPTFTFPAEGRRAQLGEERCGYWVGREKNRDAGLESQFPVTHSEQDHGPLPSPHSTEDLLAGTVLTSPSSLKQQYCGSQTYLGGFPGTQTNIPAPSAAPRSSVAGSTCTSSHGFARAENSRTTFSSTQLSYSAKPQLSRKTAQSATLAPLAEGVLTENGLTLLPDSINPSVSSLPLLSSSARTSMDRGTILCSPSRRDYTLPTTTYPQVQTLAQVEREPCGSCTAVDHAHIGGLHPNFPAQPVRLAPPTSDNRLRATNYVSLSRSSTIREPSFRLFGRQSTSSSTSITGEFFIDPDLHIPPGLLQAVAGAPHVASRPSLRRNGVGSPHSSRYRTSFAPPTAASSSSHSTPTDYPGPRVRKENLRLEVENGGIDVDVHLLPSSPSLPFHAAPRSSYCSAPDGRLIDGGTSRACSRRRHTISNSHPLGVNTSEAAGRRGSVCGRAEQRQQHVEVVPTLIALELKQDAVLEGEKGKEFHIVARIHAPTPRRPFHLLASTMTLRTRMASAARNKGLATSRLTPLSAFSSDPHQAMARSSSLLQRLPPATGPHPTQFSTNSTLLTKSDLTLHIPRNFRGPITLHVLAGDIDEHVRLSREISSAAVVLAESAYVRGYFVGGLAGDAQKEGLADEEKESDVAVRCEEGREQLYGSVAALEVGADAPTAQNVGSTGVQSQTAESMERGAWVGDKVEAVIGDGTFYLQFEDESDPFAEKKVGFWKSLVPRCRR